MFRVQSAFLVCFLCTAGLSFAADFPTNIVSVAPSHHKKTVVKTKKALLKPQQVNSPPVVTKVQVAKAPASVVDKPTPISPKAVSNLSWVLGPMTANADGGKHEASNSATANIVVDKPGTSFGPEMTIELNGHVVKTIQSTVRIDVQIGEMRKSVVWHADEIKSGIFKITINEKVAAGVLPALIPVSAIAFVTQAGEGHAAMVSLEKIVLRFANSQVISEN